MSLIAGHNFRDTPQGRRCEACGQMLTAIASASEADIGQPGIAHTGNLNAAELAEIRREVSRIWDSVMEAAR